MPVSVEGPTYAYDIGGQFEVETAVEELYADMSPVLAGRDDGLLR